jgi:hypothetical protein
MPRFLEEELARRYRDAAPATLALLQERCEAVTSELVTAEAQLSASNDVAALRKWGPRRSLGHIPLTCLAERLPGHGYRGSAVDFGGLLRPGIARRSIATAPLTTAGLHGA